MTAINAEMLNKLSTGFHADPANIIRRNAVMKVGLDEASQNQQEIIDNPMTFSVEVRKPGKITNQKSSGRCWMFAAMNVMRYEVMQNCNLETFELSQNYTLFWDKLEKANYFYNSIIATANEPLDGRVVAHLLSAPMQDGGQWDMIAAICDKYGCVPKNVMPETFHSSNTNVMCRLLTVKLREQAKELRAAVAAGKDPEALRADMLQDIYNMLVICLGEPPKTFTFEYRDKDEAFHRDADLTPRAFFDKYIGLKLSDYISVINAPTADKPYYRAFTVDLLGNVAGGRAVKYVNLPSDEVKQLAIAQLKDGKPVWFGCDVGKRLLRTTGTGLMGLNTLNYEAATGVTFGMDKAERLDYGESLMTHAMVFQGVNLDENGKPNRWKVENSWGDQSGDEGYYIMTDAWFDEYNYQVVVNKKYLSEKQLAAYALEPIVLKPWDPMGSLA